MDKISDNAQLINGWIAESEMDGRDSRSVENVHKELIHVLDQIFFTISRVDLKKDEVCFLQCMEYPDVVGRTLNWTKYLEAASGIYLPNEKEQVLHTFSSAYLLGLYESGERVYTLDALYVKNDELRSMKLMAYLHAVDGAPTAYVTVRGSSADCLRNHIINRYVYNNCDYFCYLDARHNSYKMFSTSPNGTPLPPLRCDDYTAEMISYAKSYVVPEDREYVIWEMGLARVLSQLEQKEVHAFYCGMMEPGRGYTRKKIEFRYYERSTQMILLSRTDVTEVYMEEESKRRALSDALLRAQTDSLSGLLNYQGIVENVSQILKKGAGHAALLFIDLDNFKQVNDTLGHAAGDDVLRTVATVLRQQTEKTPLIGRVGGDEFIVFFQDIVSMEEVTAYAGRVCGAIRDIPCGSGANQVHISGSVGIVEAPKDGHTYKMLVKKADEMAYYAKSHGKDRYVVYGAV